MKDRRVIELMFNWSPRFSVETMINLERNTTLSKRSNSEELTLPCSPNGRIETLINLERKQVFEWKIEELSNLLSVGHRCSNWDNNNSRKIKGLNETLKGDRAYLSEMTDKANSMETANNLERSKDLNESFLSDWTHFPGTEWVLYSEWCNERW